MDTATNNKARLSVVIVMIDVCHDCERSKIVRYDKRVKPNRDA